MTGCGTERYADCFFDLDGTLVDSAPDILRLLGGVLREEGLAVPELDKGRIGPLLEDIIRGICPDLAPADLERIVRATAPAPLTKARRSPAYRRCSSGCRGGAAGCLWLPTSRRT